MWGSKFVLLVKYLSGDEDKKDEIDVACCTYGEEERRKKALEMPMSRQSGNIEMDLRQKESCGLE
jgi:hypothetical protein